MSRPIYDFDTKVFTVEHGEFYPSAIRKVDGIYEYLQADLEMWHQEVDVEKVVEKRAYYLYVNANGKIDPLMMDEYGNDPMKCKHSIVGKTRIEATKTLLPWYSDVKKKAKYEEEDDEDDY